MGTFIGVCFIVLYMTGFVHGFCRSKKGEGFL